MTHDQTVHPLAKVWNHISGPCPTPCSQPSGVLLENVCPGFKSLHLKIKYRSYDSRSMCPCKCITFGHEYAYYNLVSVLLDGASSSKSHFSQFPRSVTRATQFIRCWQANLAMPSFSGTWVAICWSPWGSSMLFSASMSKSQWRLWSSAVQIGDMGPIKPLDLSWSIH